MMQIEFFNDPKIILVCLCLASIRVYLEIIGINLQKLPLTSKLLGDKGSNFHKTGLYLSIGYILLFAPQALMS